MKIHLASEEIFDTGFIVLTNTYLTSLLSISLIILFSLYLKSKLNEMPSKFQTFVEITFENIYNYWATLTQIKDIKVFAFTLSFFVYILVSNLLGIFPGIGSIYLKKGEEKIELLRTVYSDLNMTLALAIISVLGVNLIGFSKRGISFFKKYSGVVGILELIGEFAKILSFSFRLFGNIFAGEVLIMIVSNLFPLLAPIPFLFLEIFVGFVQALIFFILTSIFLRVALNHHF